MNDFEATVIDVVLDTIAHMSDFDYNKHMEDIQFRRQNYLDFQRKYPKSINDVFPDDWTP